MNFNLTRAQLDWQQEVRDFLKEVVTPDLRIEVEEHEDQQPGPLEKEYKRKVANKGWAGISWPKEYGGLNKTAMERFIFNEELMYANAPRPFGVGVGIVAPTLFKFGTEENLEEWLSPIMEGKIDFALGYSEPNAGTDLASLKTTAVLDGDDWIINGQKTWNTYGHRVTHQWAAARTDPEARKHQGLSVLLDTSIMSRANFIPPIKPPNGK